ncbi:DUF3300 domain-containing protein [Kaustia mangrovi]|uniref:DUF3300 domain-containing protein n=1 Tax=Kaustia mangrovi TaxID=2593653 RepID=UPI001FEB6DC6|nr:DUF3300 domain-containing protein [Kaustia mangrovi]
MRKLHRIIRILTVCVLIPLFGAVATVGSVAQSQDQGQDQNQDQAATSQQTAASQPADASQQAPKPLTEDELEVLVARIALYPDDLVSLITSASLYPLEIVQAARYLDAYEKDKSLKPKDSWDPSIISLLNYPEIVKMMNNDLDWTQQLADAITYQQKDVLVAIQQLRSEAVAKGVIKTDDKVKVVKQQDNIVIQPASTQTIYVPQYPPQMLYEPGYPPAPIGYYPTPYPYYYYPTATFFAGVVTGAIWASAIDWNHWGVWGGDWHGGNNVKIDCNNCFNNRKFNGNININDIDWRHVDRSKIKIDRSEFAKIGHSELRRGLETNRNNALHNQAARIRRERPETAPGRAHLSRDIRKSTLEGLKKRPEDLKRDRPGGDRRAAERHRIEKRPGAKQARKTTRIDHPVGRKKPAGRIDNRPRHPSGFGHVRSGKRERISSERGFRSMGGGRRGGGHRSFRHGGGRRR